MKIHGTVAAFAFVAMLLPSIAFAQVSPEQQKISDRVLGKIRTIDLYNQILPVLMTPEQIKSFLPILEKYRSDFRKLVLKEHEMLKALEADLDKSIAEIKKNSDVADPMIVKKYVSHLDAFSITRQALYSASSQELIKLLKTKLNEGQITAAANSLSPNSINGETDPKKFTQDQKLAYWVDMVLYDDLAYDILVALTRKK